MARCPERTFLQSWNWGDFQERLGNKIWRLGIFQAEDLRAVALVVRIAARRGTYFLIQHGPVAISDSKREILSALCAELKNISMKEKAIFVRLAPLFERNVENNRLFRELGFQDSPMHANAYEATWRLDLASAEEDLLRNMRKTTRYLIRQAEKNPDITIEKSDRSEDLEKYHKLNKEVAARQNFVPFSAEYIKNEFEVFARDGGCLWFFGKYKEEIAAASLVIFWKDYAFYHQAASLSKFAKLSIPYLLQWEAIKEAKKRGCASYDFWGYVNPEKNPNHPWAGPTLFKMGFGGQAFEYVKTQDLPLMKSYWLVNLFEKIRRIKRGL